MLRRIITPDVEESLRALIEYLWLDEQKDWEASDCAHDHIYRDVQRVAAWLDDGERGSV